MAKQVHTVPRGKQWGNIKANGTRVPKLYDTKAEAQAAGRKTAINQKAEHYIHNKNGRISEKNSYGDDNHPPKG